MNFILKFLDKTTSYANKYAVQREFDGLKSHFESCIERLDKRVDLYFDEIKEFNQRIAALEEKFSSQPKIVLYKNDTPSRNWDGSPKSTTDAIIGVLKDSKVKKLHYSTIYSNIKNYNLINPDVTVQSVKAILYQLARQKRIVLDNGTETGMFFIEKE